MLKLFTFGILMLLAVAASAYAQQDLAARQILDAMSEKYQNINSFRAKVQQVTSNKGEGLNESLTGTLGVKGDMFRMQTGPKEVATDGEKVYVYLEELNEITIDYYYPEESELAPSSIFDAYKSGYTYTKLPDETVNGVPCHVIDLIPANSSASQFYRIRLAISQDDSVLHRYAMWDRASTSYTFTLSDVDLNADLPDSMFQLGQDTHPGADIQDFTN